MLNYLPDIYESTLQECLKNSYAEIPGLLQRLGDAIVEECCQILNDTKNIKITTKYITNFIDVQSLTIHLGYNLYIEDQNELKISTLTFALPSAALFNESPIDFYKSIMQEIWQKSKEAISYKRG